MKANIPAGGEDYERLERLIEVWERLNGWQRTQILLMADWVLLRQRVKKWAEWPFRLWDRLMGGGMQ
jgi:hypothetical protein